MNWINIDEIAPKEDELVLVYYANRENSYSIVTGRYAIQNSYDNGTVTYWCPLSPPSLVKKKGIPLSFDELNICRKNHKPIWVKVIGYSNNKSGWAIATNEMKLYQHFWPYDLYYGSYMLDWIAYTKEYNDD